MIKINSNRGNIDAYISAIEKVGISSKLKKENKTSEFNKVKKIKKETSFSSVLKEEENKLDEITKKR